MSIHNSGIKFMFKLQSLRCIEPLIRHPSQFKLLFLFCNLLNDANYHFTESLFSTLYNKLRQVIFQFSARKSRCHCFWNDVISDDNLVCPQQILTVICPLLPEFNISVLWISWPITFFMLQMLLDYYCGNLNFPCRTSNYGASYVSTGWWRFVQSHITSLKKPFSSSETMTDYTTHLYDTITMDIINWLCITLSGSTNCDNEEARRYQDRFIYWS